MYRRNLNGSMLVVLALGLPEMKQNQDTCRSLIWLAAASKLYFME